MSLMKNKTGLLAAALFMAASSAALAQTGKNYDVKTMNFDLWCQETAHLPPDRCDKRTAEDEKTFEDYRTRVEEYEVPYLQAQQRDLSLSRDIMHNDPVDNPISQGSAGAAAIADRAAAERRRRN